MTSFIFRAPSGVPGDVTRPDDTIVEPGTINASAAPQSYGVAVKMVSGKIEAFAAADTADLFYGILSRSAPAIAGNTNESFGSGVPNPDAIQGIVRKGYVNVTCAAGDPVRGAKVWLRVVESLPSLVGDFETAEVVGETVELQNVTWALEGKDADGVTEVYVN